MLSRCFLDFFFVSVATFVIGLSQMSSFFSHYVLKCNRTLCIAM